MEVQKMLGLLPWERLPGWLLGPLMVAASIVLALNLEPYSWSQIAAATFTIAGIGIFIHGVKKLRVNSVVDAK
jgi:hypothetical protein